MTFKASLDNTAKFLTIGISILFIGIAIGPKIFSKSDNNEIPVVLILILILTYGISYVFSPISYELNEKELIIKRPLNNVTINRTQIKNVIKVEKGKLTWSIRTFGVGGLFGYFGEFWNKEFGNMTWYATRRDNAIMITTNENKKIVLTPDETEKFISAFTEIENLQPNG